MEPNRPIPHVSLPAQSDARTCGIASLCALAVRAGKARTYASAPPQDARRWHERVHRIASRTGLPWPRALGTAPWALAALARQATGVTHIVLPWGRRGFEVLEEAVRSGRDVLLYVGGSSQWWSTLIPRHVVLVLGAESMTDTGEFSIFEPGSGKTYVLSRESLCAASAAPVPAFGNWRRALLVVAPRL